MGFLSSEQSLKSWLQTNIFPGIIRRNSLPPSVITPSRTVGDVVQVGADGTAVWSTQRGVLLGKTIDMAGRVGAGDLPSLTVIGDGVGTYLVEYWATAMCSSGPAATLVYVQIFDAAGGGGTCYTSAYAHTIGAGTDHLCYCKAYIPAWTGSKTLYPRLNDSAGTPTLAAAATYPAVLSVTRV